DLGRFPSGGEADWSSGGETGGLGGGGASATAPAHALEINALTLDGPGGPTLSATWSYALGQFGQADVEALAQGWFAALEALVRHAGHPAAGGRTPSDVALARLTQDEIEGIEGRYAGIEDILPLTPLQEGLLFHALYAAQGPDVYVVQLVLRLEGALEAAVLEASARALLDRHANLRAAFVDEGLRHPVQVICGGALARWRVVDLSGLGEAEASARLEELLAADRAEHFDLAVAPLMRFTLIREGADRHRLAVAMHHILMDGWSLPVLIRELLEIYAHDGDAGSLPGVTPDRTYLGWLQGQDRLAAQAAWGLALSGLEEGTLVAPAGRERAPQAPERLSVRLSEELTGALTRYGRQEGLTLNTLVQGAGGGLLRRLTGRAGVVVQVTV